MARYRKGSEREFIASLSPAAQQQIRRKLGYDPLKQNPARAAYAGLGNLVPARNYEPLETRPMIVNLVIEGFIAKPYQRITSQATKQSQWLLLDEKRRCYDAVRHAFYDVFGRNVFPWRPFSKARLEIVRISTGRPMDDDNLHSTRKYVQDALTCAEGGVQLISDDKPGVLLETAIEHRKEGRRKATEITVTCLEKSDGN